MQLFTTLNRTKHPTYFLRIETKERISFLLFLGYKRLGATLAQSSWSSVHQVYSDLLKAIDV